MLQADDVDAVFMDIRMPGMDGLALARIIGRFTCTALGGFCHCLRLLHAVDAFDIAAVDYLLKLIRAQRLAHSRGPGSAPVGGRGA